MSLPFILLLVAILLVVVSLVQRLAARVTLSASVILALVGVAIGGTATFIHWIAPASVPGDLARRVFDLPISSETFLYIFLPILLFQSALEIEVRQMIEDAAPILLLAVVAVVVATLVIGVALAPLAGVPLVACLMLGAIVATTDPVAVIGIFQDVGAPSRLTRLVEGESLLNDAAAIALFTVLLAIVVGGGGGAGAGQVIIEFLRAFVGGIAVGYVGARLATWLLSTLTDLRLAQVTLTLALPYLVYIAGDRGLGVSGVVAAVTSGLVVSGIGQSRMSPPDWAFLHEIWEQIAFWASSLIFVLASLLVPKLLGHVGWRDVLTLAALVAAALVARAAVLFGLLPILSALRMSQRVSQRFKVVILWGGLRGAVTLALALAVTENTAVPPSIQRFVAVLATGFVFFTLLVQGTTLRPLIRMLGLDRLSPFDQALRAHVLALSHERVAHAVQSIGHRYGFTDSLVTSVTSATVETPAATATTRLERAAVVAVTDDDRLRLGLVALATREREIVLDHFASRTVSGRIVEELLADVGRLIDRTRVKGRDEYVAVSERMVQFSWPFRIAHMLHRRFRRDRLLVDRLADRFERLLVLRITIDELSPYIDEKVAALVGARAAPTLRDILRTRQQMTAGALEALVAQYPKYAELLEQRFLGRVALRREDIEYRALFDEHFIGPELYGVLRRELIGARSTLDVRPQLDLGLETRVLVAHVPMFAALAPDDLDAVARLLRPRFAVPGERLITTGEIGDAMYFISSGIVEVHAAGREIPLAGGSFFGEMALIQRRPRQADVTARSYCQLLELQDDDFQALLRDHPAIKSQIDHEAAARSEMNQAAERSPAATGAPPRPTP